MSLVRMNRAGFAVPGGFCVTEAALREHIEYTALPCLAAFASPRRLCESISSTMISLTV
jgi:phosphoenolpyruvate synthase/pyruvate phosphate dikinase